MKEYGVTFERFDYYFAAATILSFDYFTAVSEDEAKEMCIFKYGTAIDIKHVEEL